MDSTIESNFQWLIIDLCDWNEIKYEFINAMKIKPIEAEMEFEKKKRHNVPPFLFAMQIYSGIVYIWLW